MCVGERNGLQNCCWIGFMLVELWRTDLVPCFVTAHIFKFLNYFNREVSIYVKNQRDATWQYVY